MADRYLRRHLHLGWWTLLAAVALGLGLALLRLFDVEAYQHPAHETRRLMWTLAHVHGAVLGLLHILFGVSLPLAPPLAPPSLRPPSRALTAAGLLMPVGFFLGGVSIYAGDPGLGIIGVPVGAVCLLVAVVATARAR